MAAHDARQGFGAQQDLGFREQFPLLEAHMGRQEISKTQEHFTIGNFQLAHQSLQGTMLDQGARHQGACPDSLKLGQEALLLLAEVWQQLFRKHALRALTGQLEFDFIAAARDTPKLCGKRQRSMVLTGKILEAGTTFHGAQCSPLPGERP